VLWSKSAIVKVYFTELPKDVQERFHYTAENAVALQKQAEPTASEEPSPAAIQQSPSQLGVQVDDKITAVMNSPQMQKAQTSEEQIAVIKNSDLYKRGYAKQSTTVKITVADAERTFAGAESALQQELSLPVTTGLSSEYYDNAISRLQDFGGC